MLDHKDQKKWIDEIQKGTFEFIKDNSNYPESKLIKGIYLTNYQVELSFPELKGLINFFIEENPFDFELYLNFFKKLNSIYAETYNGFETCADLFVKKIILPSYFYSENPAKWSSKWFKKPDLYLTNQDKEKLKLLIFCIRCMAYTTSPNYCMQDYLEYAR